MVNAISLKNEMVQMLGGRGEYSEQSGGLTFSAATEELKLPSILSTLPNGDQTAALFFWSPVVSYS